MPFMTKTQWKIHIIGIMDQRQRQSVVWYVTCIYFCTWRNLFHLLGLIFLRSCHLFLYLYEKLRVYYFNISFYHDTCGTQNYMTSYKSSIQRKIILLRLLNFEGFPYKITRIIIKSSKTIKYNFRTLIALFNTR